MIAIKRLLPAMILFTLGCGGGGGGGTITPDRICDGGTLAPQFGIGALSSTGQKSWAVPDPEGYFVCTYAPGQEWGAVFIYAGNDETTTYDYSSRQTLNFDVKSEKGGEKLCVGTRTESDPNNGLEPRYKTYLTTEWKSVSIPLTTFVNDPEYPLSRLRHLHVVCELVLFGNTGAKVYFRNAYFAK